MDNSNQLLNILFFILNGWLAAYIAAKKGRSPMIWFLLGVFFSIFALLVLIFLPPVKSYKKPKPQVDPNFKGTTIDVKPIATGEGVEIPKNPNDRDWFYLDETRQQSGPITLNDVKDLYRRGTINDSTYLWCDGMKEWSKLSDLKIKMND